MNNFQSRISILFEKLGSGQIISLATSLNGKVFARSMSVIICNHKFYFQSENLFFADKYKKCFSGSYEKYTHLSNEVLFEITPCYIKIWDYDGGKPFREFYDCSNETYKKVFYDIV